MIVNSNQLHRHRPICYHNRSSISRSRLVVTLTGEPYCVHSAKINEMKSSKKVVWSVENIMSIRTVDIGLFINTATEFASEESLNYWSWKYFLWEDKKLA